LGLDAGFSQSSPSRRARSIF